MKITKSQLKQIIKEEIEALDEQVPAGGRRGAWSREYSNALLKAIDDLLVQFLDDRNISPDWNRTEWRAVMNAIVKLAVGVRVAIRAQGSDPGAPFAPGPWYKGTTK